MVDTPSHRGYNPVSVLKSISLLLCLLTPLGAAPSTETHFTLENGMRVILSPLPQRQAVAILSYYTTGAMEDTEPFQGISWFYGSMHGYFTTENQKSYYSFRRLTENGGLSRNSIAHDAAYFLQVATEEELNNALWSESENIFLLSPTDTELRHLFDFSLGIAGHYGPQNTLHQARMWMHTQLFLNNPGYATSLFGTPEQIKTWTIPDVLRQMKRFKDPSRVILVVTGSFNPLSAQDSIQKYFEGMGAPAAVSVNKTSPDAPVSPTTRRSWWRESLDQHYLLIGYRLPGIASGSDRAHEDFFTAMAIYHYLTQSPLNQLHRMLNRVNRLSVNITTEITQNQGANAILIRLGSSDRTTLEKARYILSREFDSLANRKLTLLQMKGLKASLKTGFYKKMADLGERAVLLAQSLHFYNHINPVERFEQDINRLDQNTIMRTVRRIFSEDKQITLYAFKKE
jgi:predicted Zn-dependent peptidase